jgi:eukaryotic-like serine/threonine-protein kinase
MDESAGWRVGSTLEGKWRLLELIGAGGMGCVFRAQHKNGSKVAIKILHPHLVHNRCLVQRFEREARLANQVEHPGVVQVFDDGKTEDGCPFLVTEFVAGQTLEARLTSLGGQLPIEEVSEIGNELLAILQAAHGRGVLHRDIKPANLLQTPSGELRILDFGIGREIEPAGNGVTSAESVLGTVGFMAPEQAQGRWDLVDEQTDLWAAGATLLKLATGLDAHEGQTPQERFAFAATRPVPALAPRAPQLPERLIQVLEKAMAFSKHDRYASATQMREALAEAAAHKSAALAAPTQPVRQRPLLTRWALVVVLGMAIAGGWNLLKRRGAHEATPATVSTVPNSALQSPPQRFEPLSSGAASASAPPFVDSVDAAAAEAPASRQKRDGTLGARAAPSASLSASPAANTTSAEPSANPLDRRR